MKFIELFKNSSIQIFDDRKYWTDEQKEVELSEKKLTMKEFLLDMANYKTMNDLGAGVFFQPNAGGRKKGEVTSIEWAYMEMDDGTKGEQMKKIKAAPVQPCMIIESMKSYHCYWWLEVMTEDQFNDLVNGLVIYFGADPANTQINRVFRLQGFKHMKYFNKPFDVKRIKFEPVRLKYEDMIKAYPKPMDKWQKEYSFGKDDLYLLKDIPIKEVLDKFGVKYNRTNEIIENNEITSAVINTKLNYINRFSGKPPSGSSIDVAMHFLATDIAGAIKWLKDEFYPDLDKKKEVKPIEPKLVVKESDKRYTWGTFDVDRKFAILKRERLTVLYGTRSQGKTTYVFDMAMKNAKLGHKVLFLSLEMQREDLIDDLARRYCGETVAEEYDRVTPRGKIEAKRKKKEDLEQADNLIFEGMRKEDDKRWATILNRILSHDNLDLIVIDNLDLIQEEDGERDLNRQKRIISDMMAFVTRYKVPIILLHHTRKKSTDGKSQGMDDMSGSGKIADGADYVLRVRRMTTIKNFDDASDKEKHGTILFLEKSRGYDMEKHELYFNKGTFVDSDQYDGIMEMEGGRTKYDPVISLPYKD